MSEWKPGDPLPDREGGYTVVLDWNNVALTHLLDAAKKEYREGGYPALVDAVRRAMSANSLVVLDLSDEPSPFDRAERSEAARLVDMLRETAGSFFVPDAAELARKVAEQIQQQTAAPTPRIEEPTGWGAVVEDDTGAYWTLYAPEAGVWINYREGKRRWHEIKPVRLVGPGIEVTP